MDDRREVLQQADTPALALLRVELRRVNAALLHRRETEQVVEDRPPVELRFDWEPDLR